MEAAAKAARPRITLDDWLRLPEDEPGEVVDGFLEEEEVSDFAHEMVVLWLGALLRGWAATRGGFVAASEVKMVLPSGKGRKADLVVVLSGRPPRRGPLRAPPEIAIEIVSPSPRDERRDRIEKMSEYAAFGIKYYWLVDPTLGALEVFELGADGRYARALAAVSGTLADLPGCPGLKVDLDALWAELERLGPEVDA